MLVIGDIAIKKTKKVIVFKEFTFCFMENNHIPNIYPVGQMRICNLKENKE